LISLFSEVYLIYASAAFLGGFINSLAGGGTLITLPVLIFSGLPPIMANATSAAALLPGYLSTALGFKKDILNILKKDLVMVVFLCTLFSLTGAFFLVTTTDEVFGYIVPWLIAFATLLFALKPILDKTLFQGSNTLRNLGLSLISTYGGYFNGGLGIALLATISLGKEKDLNTLMGMRSLLSFFITLTSVSFFYFYELIAVQIAMIMMLFSFTGGYIGSKAFQLIPPDYARYLIILIGLSITITLFIQR
tara:strand:- start:12304 stop:13053 length:750 start_codon:yes stop_codon:yes gene_type:complete